MDGGTFLVEAGADPVDHVMQLAGHRGIFGDLAGQGKGSRIEQSPWGFVTPVMRRLFVGLEHLGNTGDVDNPLPVHLHDALVGQLVRQRQCLVPIKGQCLGLARIVQRLNYFSHQPRKVTFGVRCMLALDQVIGVEGQIVADKDAGTDGDADRELLLVAVSQEL